MICVSATHTRIAATVCLLAIGQPAISQEYIVQRGDSLGSIAQAQFGNGAQWRLLCDLNSDRLDDCDRIFVGMSLRLAAPERENTDPVLVTDQVATEPLALSGTNILNVDLTTARVGVLGEEGQLPHGWRLSFSGGAEGQAEVVAVTTDYLEIEITQTASQGAPILQFANDQNWKATQANQSWTFGAQIALVSGSLAENGVAMLGGTERDENGRALGRIRFADSMSLDDTLQVISGQAIMSEPQAVQMNPDFRVQSRGPWQARFRVGQVILAQPS